MLSRTIRLAILASFVACAQAWPSSSIKNLVTFGDSYTDIGMDGYNNGTSWPEYVQQYTGVNLYPFAVGGAVCSNKLTFRSAFPNDVMDAQLGRYYGLVANGDVSLSPAETVYSLWIGTNDVGPGCMLTGQATPGTTIVEVTACTLDWARSLYRMGARNFIFQNMVPLDLCSQYSANSYPNRFWTADRNTTEWNIFMKQLVASGNTLSQLMVSNLARELPGVTIGYFDSHSLFNAIHNSPSLFLNGTAPLNVTGCVASCVFELHQPVIDWVPIFDQASCTVAQGTDRDSFMWYDELHPSEQTNRVVARAISNLLQGKGSMWTTFYYGPSTGGIANTLYRWFAYGKLFEVFIFRSLMVVI